jgi:predicted nucleic acid-binding protein
VDQPHTVTFVDAGVLIAAARGIDEVAAPALDILDDPNRLFVSSVFVRLEVLPKAVFHRNKEEAEFYRTFFRKVARWAKPGEPLLQSAYRYAVRWGLSAVDALHVAAARSLHAAELVTTERSASPLCRSRVVRVLTIHEY